MRRFLSMTFAVGAVAAAAAMPASALSPSSTLCSAAVSTPGYIDCAGAFEGNNLGNASRLADVQAGMLASFGRHYALVGSSDDDGHGPFANDPDGSSGTLTFDAPVAGSFVVALKASNAFSLYRFDGGTAGIRSIDFDTLGVSVNRKAIAQGLSHATLYGGTPPVPENETYVLMLAGIGVIAAVARRRRAPK